MNERITGGALATLGQFPFLVSITENDRHFCAGFIYNTRWIVTTASCVVGYYEHRNKIVRLRFSARWVDICEPPFGDWLSETKSARRGRVYKSREDLFAICLRCVSDTDVIVFVRYPSSSKLEGTYIRNDKIVNVEKNVPYIHTFFSQT